MQITPNKLTIAQLFATPNEQFIVPSYQRRYAWKFPQYMALFEDIQILKNNDGHLFGMIILHSSTHIAGLNSPELVDGQQRLTTLVLLLRAFEYIYKIKFKDEDKAGEIRKMITCKGLDEVVKPKIILGDLDNPDMETALFKDDFDRITNLNIKACITGYIETLNELDKNEVNRVFFDLTTTAVLIRLDVSMAQDAYKLFETINNRGLKLNPTDIIKNFLLGHAAKIQDDNTLDEVKKLWSQIIVNLDDLDSDDFLRQYMCSVVHNKVTFSQLINVFKNYYINNVQQTELINEFDFYIEEDFEDETEASSIEIEKNENKISIITFLERLVKLSNTYRKVSYADFDNPKIRRKILGLNFILSKPSYIFLMHFMQDETTSNVDKLKVLHLIEVLMLRRHICERRTSENDTIFSKLVEYIGAENIHENIKSYLVEDNHIPEDNDFEVSLPKHQFKGKLINRAKYMLECIEESLCGNTNEKTIASALEVHLEHIIPQTIDTKKSKNEFGDWEVYLGQNSKSLHKRYVNQIGNMTLLGQVLNIQAYNNPFAKKKNSYKKSNINLNNKLGDMSNFKFSHLEKRNKELTEYALSIWTI